MTSHAEAQGLFGGWDSPPPKILQKPKRPSSLEAARKSERSSKSKEPETASRAAEGPLVVVVSLNRQRLTVYDAGGPIASSPVSSGRVGYATPTGVFTVVQKRRMHYSNLYENAPMPNMQRLTWSGVALHAGVLPGYPASHGCIRLPHGFSKKLFGMTSMGTRVIVTRDPVSPQPIAHHRLFTAFPPEEETASTRVAEETRVADASMVLGVSPAVAAAHETASISSHSTYRERRRLEAEKLNAEIRTAGYAKAGKQALLAQAHKAAAITREPLITARADAERLEEERSKLETELERSERELADLKAPPVEAAGAKKKQKAKRMDESKRIARIKTLEERVSRLPGEIEAVRASQTHALELLHAAEGVAKEAEDKRRVALKAYTEANAALQNALAREQAAKKLEAMRDRPVSIFISRAKQRLYIRQGYDDVLDVAVTFDRPDEPVGTHVFTALSVAENKTDMTWSVVSIPHDPTRGRKSKQTKKDPPPQPAVDRAAQTAASALDRITVPDEVREQIADVMKPGSSIVISDLGIGNETGAYTDFIVPIR